VNSKIPGHALSTDKWHVVFVSEEERYGLCVKVGTVLQLTCRNMIQPIAQRMCEALNQTEAQRAFEAAYTQTG